MDVRTLVASDVSDAARVLASAFDADPFTRWLYAETDRRRRFLASSFERQIRHVYMPKGHSYIDDSKAGVALWAPPGAWKLPVGVQVRLFPFYARSLPTRRLPTLARVFSRIERAHPPEPHWYLAILGVDPDRQRTGVGSALLAPVLEEADASGTLSYLETSEPTNIAYYERHGFQVRDSIDLPSGAPPLWTMSRASRV